jgi:hypothetical protein
MTASYFAVLSASVGALYPRYVEDIGSESLHDNYFIV